MQLPLQIFCIAFVSSGPIFFTGQWQSKKLRCAHGHGNSPKT
uniref:Uncharacterized protein n=1 Tax=Arundo donax TaxID=35708 RepID=A0A0A9C6N6_ARUDO